MLDGERFLCVKNHFLNESDLQRLSSRVVGIISPTPTKTNHLNVSVRGERLSMMFVIINVNGETQRQIYEIRHDCRIKQFQISRISYTFVIAL